MVTTEAQGPCTQWAGFSGDVAKGFSCHLRSGGQCIRHGEIEFEHPALTLGEVDEQLGESGSTIMARIKGEQGAECADCGFNLTGF